MHPYSSIDTTAARKKLRFILSVRSDFHMIESLSIAVHAFVSRVSMSFSVNEMLSYVSEFVCVEGALCVVGGRQNYLRHLWSGIGVSRRLSFVYFGVKTTQSAVPAKTYETGRKGRRTMVSFEWDSRADSQRFKPKMREAGQSTPRCGSWTVRGRYGVKNEDTEL